jgi:hypothetical protein
MNASQIKKEIFRGRVNTTQQAIGWAGIVARYKNCGIDLAATLAGLAGAIATGRVGGMADIAITRRMTVSELADLLAELFDCGNDQDAIARHINASPDRFTSIWRRKKAGG